MRTYLRLLKYVKPYWIWLVTSLSCMIVFALLSSFSVTMIAPFLRALFFTDNDAHVTLSVDSVIGDNTEAQSDSLTFDEKTETEISPEIPDESTHRAERAVGITQSIDRFLREYVENFFLKGSKMDALRRICLVFFFAFLLKNVFHYVQSYTMAYIERRVMKDIRDELFDQFSRLPLSYYHDRRAGELISRVTNDVEVVNKGINVSFTNLSRDPVLILMYLSIALYISWKLTLAALIVLPISIFVIVKIGRQLRTFSTRQQEKMAVLTSILHEVVTGIRVVKAFAMEKFESSKFRSESEKWFKEVFSIARVGKLASPLTEQFAMLIGLALLWYGGSQVIEGGIPPQSLILFLACIFSMMHPIKELSKVNNSIQEGLAAAVRIFHVLDTPTEFHDEKDAVELKSVKGSIQYENVSFSYIPDEPVLKNVNFSIKPGEVLALVGPSGAGKSTLADLLPRFYQPQTGRIMIDGIDIKSIKLTSLRNLMGIVTQEIILFNDTVRNNIAYGLKDIPEKRIINASKAANAHEFIVRLPDQYDTFIGDRGVKLSGGQRQRISIARAILKNPPFLIFDEATSSLDTESEQQVQEAIDNLVRDRTTLVIAHRLSTIQNADRILVIVGGEIVQSGTHRSLIREEGVYKTLYELQFRKP